MATLTLSPFGLRPVSNRQGGAPTYQLSQYWIQNGSSGAIGFGDPVIRSASPRGYVAAYSAGTSHILGVFMGVAPYYDSSAQQIIQRPGYLGTEKPPSGYDVPVWVMDDQQAVMIAQLGGTNAANPALTAQYGGNIDMAIGTPNAIGFSTSYLDATSYNNTTSTLPLRVIGPASQFFLGFDPTLYTNQSQPTNNYLAVVFNTSEYTQTTGI